MAAAAPSRRAGRLLAWLRGAWDAETALCLGLLAVGFLGGILFRLQVNCPGDPATLGLLPAQRWPSAWATLAANTWDMAVHRKSHGSPRGHAAAAAALCLLLLPGLRRQVGPSARAALTLVAGIAVYGLFVGTHQWVAVNSFHVKYWIPVLLCLYSAFAILLAGPVFAWAGPRAHRWLYLAVAPTAVAAAAGAFGSPSLARVRAAIEQQAQLGGVPLPQCTADLLATRATHVAGTYANVWVNAFHANLALYERGEDRVIWAMTGRSMPTWDQWAHLPPEDMRIAALVHDQQVDCDATWFCKVFLPPLTRVEQHGTVWLYRPTETLCSDQWPADARTGPFFLSYHSGFNGREGDDKHNVCWCARRGKLTVYNRTEATHLVTLDMQLRTGHPEPAALHIDSDLFSEHLAVNDRLGRLTRTFALPPGRHLVCFDCDARAVKDVTGFRSFVFRVEDVTLTDRGELRQDRCTEATPRSSAETNQE
jgi:hypothetical protein